MLAAVARHTCDLLLVVVLGGLLGATLVRFAPGFDVDERQLDARLSEETLQLLRAERAGSANVLAFYGHHLAGLFRLDLGVSHSLKRPISELLRERFPVTLRAVVEGLAYGWLAGLALAAGAAAWRSTAFRVLSTTMAGFCLCVPAALIGLLMVFLGGGIPAAIALVVFPKVFSYTRNVLQQAYASAHVLNAKARGLYESRVLFFHVLPTAAPDLAALIGVSASLALGASIPMEAICDQPGIGQLAWRAAHSRDLPLLVNLTLLIAFITRLVNGTADIGAQLVTRRWR
jgi:peptide/nickel transport system permease protein